MINRISPSQQAFTTANTSSFGGPELKASQLELDALQLLQNDRSKPGSFKALKDMPTVCPPWTDGHNEAIVAEAERLKGIYANPGEMDGKLDAALKDGRVQPYRDVARYIRF